MHSPPSGSVFFLSHFRLPTSPKPEKKPHSGHRHEYRPSALSFVPQNIGHTSTEEDRCNAVAPISPHCLTCRRIAGRGRTPGGPFPLPPSFSFSPMPGRRLHLRSGKEVEEERKATTRGPPFPLFFSFLQCSDVFRQRELHSLFHAHTDAVNQDRPPSLLPTSVIGQMAGAGATQPAYFNQSDPAGHRARAPGNMTPPPFAKVPGLGRGSTPTPRRDCP